MEQAEECLYLQVIDKAWLVFEVGSVFLESGWMKECTTVFQDLVALMS
jgi:hypothetical protein